MNGNSFSVFIYERKKAGIQDIRYDQAYERAVKRESKELTFEQILNLCLNDSELRQIYDETEKVEASQIRIILRERYQVTVSRNKAYEFRTAMLRRLSQAAAM